MTSMTQNIGNGHLASESTNSSHSNGYCINAKHTPKSKAAFINGYGPTKQNQLAQSKNINLACPNIVPSPKPDECLSQGIAGDNESPINEYGDKIIEGCMPRATVHFERRANEYRSHRPDCLSLIDRSTCCGSPETNLDAITVPQFLVEVGHRFGDAVALSYRRRSLETDPASNLPTPTSPTSSSSCKPAAIDSKSSGTNFVTPEWETMTYAQYLQNIKIIARAFISLGLERYHGVGIIGFNAPEWLITNFAAIFAGGLSAGIYTTNNPAACFDILQDCEANICVVEDGNHMKKILAVADKLPHLKAIIQYKESKNFPIPSEIASHKTFKILKWSELANIAESTPETCLDARMNSMKPNNCCTLIYTSGTTGNSKGVMISHDNLTWTARVLSEFLECRYLKERVVSYLPLSHIAAQMVDMYMLLCKAATIYFAQPDALKGSLIPTLKEVKPTIFCGVPRVWEKIADKIMASSKSTTGLKRHVIEWAKSIGVKSSEANMRGLPLPWGHYLADKIMFSKIRNAIGLECCRFLICTGAPASLHTIKYFESIGMKIHEIYGASECTGPASINYPTVGLNWIGSCGVIFPGSDIKIMSHDMTPLPPIKEHQHGGDGAEDMIKDGNESTLNGEDGQQNENDIDEGEICIKGRHVFMGYLNMEQMNIDTIDDNGYFHTGDMGKLVKTVTGGPFLNITGRIKELIVTAGGENVAPLPIENAIKEELGEIISNAMVVGDRRKFLSILLTFKLELCETTGLPTDKLSESARNFIQLLIDNSKNVTPDNPFLDASIKRGVSNGYVSPSSPWSHPNSPKNAAVTPDLSKNALDITEANISSMKWLKSYMPDALRRYISDGIDLANVKAVSRAAFIRKWIILEHDFTVSGGELGPTMKLRRPFILKKYGQVIESIYDNTESQNDQSSEDTKQSS